MYCFLYHCFFTQRRSLATRTIFRIKLFRPNVWIIYCSQLMFNVSFLVFTTPWFDVSDDVLRLKHSFFLWRLFWHIFVFNFEVCIVCANMCRLVTHSDYDHRSIVTCVHSHSRKRAFRNAHGCLGKYITNAFRSINRFHTPCRYDRLCAQLFISECEYNHINLEWSSLISNKTWQILKSFTHKNIWLY